MQNEIPSNILLDDDDDEEEPGEIVDDSFQPFDYDAIQENNLFAKSKSIVRMQKFGFLLFLTEKFKRPADDEDIYDPNRQQKKSAQAKVNISLFLFNLFFFSRF